MNIGVIGGTFDPIHNGHLAVADEVRIRLDMAEVLFVPAGQPWFKVQRPISSAEHRLEMVRLAISGRSGYKLSAIEIDRPGPTYTVDTVAELQARLKPDDSLFFIMGWDNLAGLPDWKEPARLINLCCLVAVPRPGCSQPDLEALDGAIPGLSGRVVLMDRPEVDISASDIRDRVARGLPIDQLVPAPVAAYIREHGLYTAC